MNKFFYMKWWKDLCQRFELPRDSNYEELLKEISNRIRAAREEGKSKETIEGNKTTLVINR